MYRFKFLLLISVLQICSSIGQDFGVDCQYEGDMCDVDPEKCLRRLKEENRGLISDCYGIQYGPGPLYKTRKDTTFWIKIAKWMRSEYPPGEDLTYTIYSKKVGRTNWTVPDSLTSVPGCCSMKITDTCILPKREPGEAQYIFMPLEQSESYCIFELEEESGEPEQYCENDDELKCIEFVNGTVRRRGLYIPLSTESYQPITDFCFFTPPNNDVNVPNNTESYVPFTEKGISAFGSGDDIIASLPTQNISCTLIKGIREDNIALLSAKHYQSWMGNFACYFLRLPEFSGVWLDARCEEQILAPEDDDDWKVIIGVVVALCLAIIIVIMIVFVTGLYKKHLMKFTFEKTIEELPDTFSWDKLEGKRFIDDENITITNSQTVKEIPDEFTFPYHDKIISTLAKSTGQLPANGDSFRYTKVDLMNGIREISSSATPQCSDSGFHSVSGELTSPEDNSKRTDNANAKVSSNSEHDSGFSTTSFSSGDSGMSSSGLGPCKERDFNASINGYTEKNLMLLGLPKKKMTTADAADEKAISLCHSEDNEKSQWDADMTETSSNISLYVRKSSLNTFDGDWYLPKIRPQEFQCVDSVP